MRWRENGYYIYIVYTQELFFSTPESLFADTLCMPAPRAERAHVPREGSLIRERSCFMPLKKGNKDRGVPHRARRKCRAAP